MPPTGDLSYNPGMCPDWELNWWPFGLQAHTQSTEPHHPGPYYFFKDFLYLFLERGEGKEKERERNINVWLPLTWPLLGTWPVGTQACALTGTRTGDLLVHSPRSIHWATPAGARWHVLYSFFKSISYWLCYYSCPIFFYPLFPSALHLPPTSIPHPT